MTKPAKNHAWRNCWHKVPPGAREPNGEGEMPQVDPTTLTPKESRAADAAALEAVQASRPRKPPGKR